MKGKKNLLRLEKRKLRKKENKENHEEIISRNPQLSEMVRR